MKIRSVGAELFHADWRTAMTKLKVAFCSFTKAPEKRMRKKDRDVKGGDRTTRDK
jgi:hypothetical protein